MSYEAWGEPDDYDVPDWYYTQTVETLRADGWLDDEQVAALLKRATTAEAALEVAQHELNSETAEAFAQKRRAEAAESALEAGRKAREEEHEKYERTKHDGANKWKAEYEYAANLLKVRGGDRLYAEKVACQAALDRAEAAEARVRELEGK